MSLIEKKKSIGEVAKELSLPEHTLRFWETEFSEYIKPNKSESGRRFYYNDDVRILFVIKDYLYNKGYTIKGLKNLLKNNDININECAIIQDNSVVEKNIEIKEKNNDIKKEDIKVKEEKIYNPEFITNDLKNFKDKLYSFYEKIKSI